MKKIILGFLCSLLMCSTAWAVKNPDTLIEAVTANQQSLDPYFQYDISSNEPVKNVYENLLAWDKDSVTKLLPHLATKVPTMENGLISKDGTVYRFPIRKGVTFHNGNTLTPSDVEYTFERAMIFDRAGGPSWMLLEPITGYSSIEGLVEDKTGTPYAKMFDDNGKILPKFKKVLTDVFKKYIDPAVSVDGDDVVVKLASPYAPFLSELPQGAGWCSIMDEQWSAEVGAWDGKADDWWEFHDPKAEKDPLYDKMNGTGPYKLVEWNNGVSLTMTRYDNYWGTKPAVKNVKIMTMPEWSTRKAALLAGDVDIADVDAQYVSQVEGKDGIRVFKGLDQLSLYMLFFNQEITVKGGNRYIGSGKLDGEGIPADFFADVHVRRAFKYMYDAQTIIRDVMGGNAQTAYGPVVKPLLGYDAKGADSARYNLAKAKEEFKLAMDGKLWEKGFKFTIAYATGRTDTKAVIDMLTYNARSINPKFKIESQSFAWNTLLSDYLQGFYPMWALEWNADYPDPHNMAYPILHHTGFYGSALGTPYAEWAKKNVEPLLDEGVREFDLAKREALYKDICKKAEDDAVILFLYQPTRIHVERDWVKGWFNNAINESHGRHFYLLSK